MKVYRFRLYDVASEDFKISARMATPACIRRIHAEIIKRTELEIDKRYVNSEGLTEIGVIDPDATRTYLTSRGEPAKPVVPGQPARNRVCSTANHFLVPFGDW